MSHSYPYRGSTSDTDLRPEAGHYRSENRRHNSPNIDFYRPSQESFSSSYPSSSSSRGPTWAQDGALSILDSCGLKPSDLALLAELPEDVLTVESLPHVLNQIKGKRGAVRSFVPGAPSPSSSYSSSSYPPGPGSSSRIWDHLHSQTIQCQLDHLEGSLPIEQERWRNSRTSSSVRSAPTASSASLSSPIYAADFHCRPRPSEYGKTGRRGGAFSSQDCSSFSSAEQDRRSRPTGISETRSALPSDVYHPKPRVGHQEYQTSSTRSSSRQAAATSIPSEKEALDFHGTCPTVFPYSCSLCDITVLSEMVWIKHINNSQHAEGQLSLLQQFPNWDCRVESVSRAKNQEKRKDEEKTPHSAQNDKSKPDAKSNKKPSEKGKVVCVKFPPQSVDETYLRKLTEPFGKIVKILMFPSLAFLELSSTEQAKELVKFHSNCPPTVSGEQIEFSISNTFSFLQSSQVVSFTPVPTGEDGQSDLMSIVKRFGPPRYYLFLPSMAYVEMEHARDAQKLVDYYSSNNLRINNTCVKVSFSGEYKTLMRVPSANKYEEQKVSTKRTRSSSPDKEVKTKSKRRRSSRDREHERGESKTRSREGSRKDRRTRARSRSTDKSSPLASRDNSKEIPNREGRSRSREGSSRDTRSRSRKRSNTKGKTRSRSRDKPKEQSSTGSRTRSRSTEKPNKENKTRSRSADESTDGSNEKSVEEEKAETESRKKQEAAPQVEVTVSSTEDSDIEGMEVIGEDGELVQEEFQNDVEAKEASEIEHQLDRTDSLEEKPTGVTVENEEQTEDVYETKQPEGESESVIEMKLEDEELQEASDFPVDLENCITLDDLEDDNQGEDIRDECLSRVVSFRDLPTSFFTDADFIGLVRDHGKAVRYLLLRQSQEGFIEMWSSSEAQRAVQELNQKTVTLNGSTIFVNVSHKYQKLSNGWEIDLESSIGNEQQSRTPDREETSSKSSKEASEEGSDRLAPERELSATGTNCGVRTTSDPESSRDVTEESASEKTQKEPLAETSEDDDSGMNRGSDGEKDRSMEETPDSKPQLEQKPKKDDQLHDSGSVHPELGPGPVGGGAEPQEPTRPVGTQFVRPVVGYFCSLCQLIYADEEEAKQQHCSSPMHYSKYQEKTGKNPWKEMF